MERYRIKPGSKVKLDQYDPDETKGWDGNKDDGLAKLEELKKELETLQDVLYAESKQKILIVIQAMDTAGKDGTIHSVFSGVNPQGVKVVSFKVPTVPEMAHDYLWRVHAQVPGKGEIVIFNRSHYEDVLVVRVHNFAPPERWSKRYAHIAEFERMLAEEGTTIIKFFLFIDLDTQKKRLIERIETPEKQWKFNPGDLPERKLWPQYQAAYEEALSKTSTEYAPWYVIPSNHNWYRNYLVANIIVEKLRSLKMTYPKPTEDLTPYKQQLEAGA